MRVALATGIYPPAIGGPATYVRELAAALRGKGHEVRIITYGDPQSGDPEQGVTRVAFQGGPLLRYLRYARALRTIAEECDVVEAFSSVSVGVPLWLAHLRHPKKVLRLGGDFLWERATDRGEERGLREWYEKRPLFTGLMNGLLRTFDAIVFSTAFQEELYRRVYRNLPPLSVIENVSPQGGSPTLHTPHRPVRLLFLGRFVAFKNLRALLEAMLRLPEATLTLAGSGPTEEALRHRVSELQLQGRVTFLPARHGEEKTALFREHDIAVLPSKTEISPHSALEARAAGLPVLLTEETGLSRILTEGMVVTTLRTPDDIARAIEDVCARYAVLAERAAQPLPERDWSRLADEHLSLFVGLL